MAAAIARELPVIDERKQLVAGDSSNTRATHRVKCPLLQRSQGDHHSALSNDAASDTVVVPTMMTASTVQVHTSAVMIRVMLSLRHGRRDVGHSPTENPGKLREVFRVWDRAKCLLLFDCQCPKRNAGSGPWSHHEHLRNGRPGLRSPRRRGAPGSGLRSVIYVIYASGVI